MDKRIFAEQEANFEPHFQPKREFDTAEVTLEADMTDKETAILMEDNVKPSRLWGRLVFVAFALFSVAAIAQSIQWLLAAWQQHQWIALLFVGGGLVISLAAIGIIASEWRKLVRLRKHYDAQQASQQFLTASQTTSGEMAVNFCKQIVERLPHQPSIQRAVQQWQGELEEGYNAQEVLLLFNQTVLNPIDEQVKQWISKNAAENAVLVAVSPLAVVDMLMIAWRNLALVNHISRAYGMELGYLSRLKLVKMVLKNTVFAGVSEMATDVGLSFFSQNLTAQISMRAAQGVALGLLSARLGIKTMAFCRPIAFSQNEQPTLSAVRKTLLDVLKASLFGKKADNIHYE